MVSHQVIQVNDTSGGLACLAGVCVSELGGNGGGLKEPAPSARLLRAIVVVVVVVRLEVLLADEQLADRGQPSVHIHVQSKKPLAQPLRVHHREAVEDEVPLFGVITGVHTTPNNHFFFIRGNTVFVDETCGQSRSLGEQIQVRRGLLLLMLLLSVASSSSPVVSRKFPLIYRPQCHHWVGNIYFGN